MTAAGASIEAEADMMYMLRAVVLFVENKLSLAKTQQKLLGRLLKIQFLTQFWQLQLK